MATLTLTHLTTEPSYVRLMIRRAAESAIGYSALNTDRRACQEHTDALAVALRGAVMDYLSKAKGE